MRMTFQGPQDSVIDPQTLAAYRETDYHVDSDAPFTLRIGAASSALTALHAAHRVSGSAFITACNPLGRRLDATQNTHQQAALAAELEECGYPVLRGTGLDPTGAWPGEPSFLVLGMGLEAARSLGRQFRQNAIVWSGADATPQLILLR